MIYKHRINKRCEKYVMNTDNKERFGLARVAPLHANPDENGLHARVDITPSLGEYHALYPFRLECYLIT